MKNRHLRLSAAGLALALAGGLAAVVPAAPTAAVTDDPAVATSAPDASESIALLKRSKAPARAKRGLIALVRRLGDDGLARIDRIKRGLGVAPVLTDPAAQQAIDPDDYDCTAYDALSFWRVEQLARFEVPANAITLDQLGVYDLSMVDAMLTQGERVDAFPAGTETATRSAFRAARTFWGPPGSPVRLAGVDTSVWAPASKERWIDAIGYLFGIDASTPEQRESIWNDVRPYLMDTFATEPSTRDGRAPLFASGIQAYDPAREGDRDPILGKQRTLLVGTGYYRAMQAAGFGRISMKAAVAQEYAEFVQVDAGSIDDAGTPEAGRRNGLLRDAMSGYFLEHRKGLDITAAQRRIVLDHASALGDCDFWSASHQGTPNQARKAMRWGMNRPAGPITAPAAFAEAFDAALPRILRPDAGQTGN